MSRRGAIAVPSVQLLKVAGLTAPVHVRRHPTARRLTLRVSRTERRVILTIPRNLDLSEADRFLARSIDWVRERLEGVPEPAPFRSGGVIPLRGVEHELYFAGPHAGRPVVEIVPGLADRRPRLVVCGPIEHAPRRLRDWLVAEAARDLEQRVAHHAARLGLRARRITLRDQKSRWGSCSSAGQLSFSWRLILAPASVLDYVAAHEVAHLGQMNHSPRFWKLVATTMPAYAEPKAWLRRNGMNLYRYGVGV